METTIQLVNKKIDRRDQVGVPIYSITKRKVFSERSSIGSNEYFKAATNDLKPSCKFDVFYSDYHDERYIQWADKCFSIYRVYHNEKNDRMELYCEEVNDFNEN